MTRDRIEFLQGKIREQGLSGVLLLYSRDIFYYTGTAQPSYLVVLPEDYLLFVRSGFECARDEVFIEQDRIRDERRLEVVYREIFSKLAFRNKIGTELDILPTKEFERFKKVFSDYDFVDVSTLILEQRKRKDPEEISAIRNACEAVDMGHRAVLSSLRVGMTELELAAAVENAHRLAGHEGIFFIRQPDFFMSRGPISSGRNLFKNSGVVYTITGVGLSPSVPAGPSRKKISKGDLVIVDIPTLVNGYHADQTRTYILGHANERVKKLYGSLREIADILIANIKPGVKCGKLYEMAVKKAEELKVSHAFLNFGRGKRSRLIGHGIGLELNEPPIVSKDDQSLLLDGYVVALDMHMMDEDVGVCKLEDVILVTPQGSEILTTTPRDLIEIP